MNLQKITDFFPWDSSSSLRSHCVLCLDQSSLVNTNHSGEFLLTTLLLKLLQGLNREGATRVMLLLTNHNRQHYETIAKKNYLDLKSLEKSGKLCIVSLYANEAEKNEAMGCPWKAKPVEGAEQHWTWRELSSWQQRNMPWPLHSNETGETSSINEFMLLIDDLEALEILAESVSSARIFVSDTLSFVDDDKSDVEGLICFGRHPVETKMQLPTMTEFFVVKSESQSAHTALHSDSGEPRLSEYLRYRADITLVASPLLTGHSSQIHGTIAIQQSSTDKKLLLQYKALDSGVVCAPRGDGW